MKQTERAMAEGTILTKNILEAIRKDFGDKVFNTVIRKNVRIAEAPSHRQSIFEYDERSHGAADYLNLAREVLQWRKPRMEIPAATGGVKKAEYTAEVEALSSSRFESQPLPSP